MNRFILSFLIKPLFFSVLVFLGVRSLLLMIYSEYFFTLSYQQIAKAFFWGLKFDFSIAALAYTLPLVGILLLQFFPRVKKQGEVFFLWLAFSLFVLLWILYVGSVGYFGEVNRHIGYELVALSSDMGFLLQLALSSYLYWLLISIVILLLLAFFWHKLIVFPSGNIKLKTWKNKSIVFIIFILFDLLAVRGFEFRGKPVAIADAFALGDEKQAALALNGAFSALHNLNSAIKNKEKPIVYFDKNELSNIKDSTHFLSFEREIPSYFLVNENPRNIIVILLESWSYKYIDGLSGSHFGVTPFMDGLIKKSAVWDNTFAAGQRSIEGIQAILTSVPLIEGRDTIGFGLEQQRMTSIAKEAKNKGYHTVFMQTSKRRSFHVDAIAGTLGFDEYYGMEDFPSVRDYHGEDSNFGWDYEGLSYLGSYLQSPEIKDKPVFSFFFTGTTHEPFPNPGAEFHAYPQDENWENRYLNTLKYSDWALEKFVSQLINTDKYHDSIFIFVADHVLKVSQGSKKESFQVPLIIYTPDGSIPAARHKEIASQYDILPTMAALLGIRTPVATFGRSLLTESEFEQTGALSKQGGVALWFEPNRWTSFNALTGQFLESSDAKIAGKNLQWSKLRLQMADDSLRRNQWLSAPK